jgi:outer membrane biogenesis lipoprotein LolB
MSRFKIAGSTALFFIALLLTGCDNPGSENTNANVKANTNANAPVVAANTNANANDNQRLMPTREEYEKNKEKYQKEAKDAGRKIGAGLSDGYLWVKARYDLAAANDLSDSTIYVDVENGAVTLTGSVPTPAQKARAEQVVKSVEGVTSVKNQITIAGSENKNTNANANSNRKKPKS